MSNIEISWQAIFQNFEEKFNEVYAPVNSKKLYFSNGTKIDGATNAWIALSILDGLLYILDPSLPRTSSKRAFSSKSAIIDAINTEFQLKNQHNPFYSTGFRMMEEDSCWENYEILQEFLLNLRVSKKQVVNVKLNKMISYLFESLSKFGSLSEVIHQAINIIYHKFEIEQRELFEHNDFLTELDPDQD